jgi:hypothetical protein
MCATSQGEIQRQENLKGHRKEEGQGMSVVRSIERGILGPFTIAMLMVLCNASPAVALSPWWHLTSSSRPTHIQPGAARDEVQEITVSATEGIFALTAQSGFEIFQWNATHEEVQAGLEGIYGVGNVTVSGGPGDETGSKPYIVTFVGALSDQAVEPISTFAFLECGGATSSACKGEATLTEKVKGVPDGQIVLTVTNLGDASVNGESTPVSIADQLPSGLRAIAISGVSGTLGERTDGPVHCSLASLTCTFTGILPPLEGIEVDIPVVVDGASSGETNEANVSGGGAPNDSVKQPITMGASTPFGVEDYELAPEEEGGTPDTQAGSHMFQLTTTLALNQTSDAIPAGGLTKDLHFKLPPGLIGSATAIPQCSIKEFLTPVLSANECSSQSAVGAVVVTVNLPTGSGDSGLNQFTVPVFNIAPAVGEPARFGFYVVRSPVILDTQVRTGGDYGVTVNVDNVTQMAAFIKNEVTLWGVPGDPRHDGQRGWGCLFDSHNPVHPQPCSPLEEAHPLPLLTMPTSCTGPLQTSVETDSWDQEGDFRSFPSSEPMVALDGCNRLPFNPSISVTPDGQAGSTPTGLTVTEHVPQEVSLDANGLGEANVKDTTVALPAGVALNPAAADGLGACSESQVALSVNAPVSCPEASKVATVEISTPVLPDPIVGEAYLAAQSANPFGSLVALYIVAEDPTAGVLVKVAGEVKPDPVTGQLVSTFKGTPQVPFEDLKLHFFGGSRAPLGTPALCGAYTTTASIAPWSGNDAVDSSSEFEILSGPNGSACADPLPFSPSLTAGSTNIQTGAFTPFTMTMSREDGQQNLRAVQLHMPAGLLGTLSNVKLCDEAKANAGTCGPESLIGETVVSVGLGGDPYSVRGGRVYITEGYAGAPYGLSIVNPAKAGPYDLGQVIVRAKIEVDPITAALTVTTDVSGPYAVPQIIDGIPLQIKHVNVTINRPNFTFNPTNCRPTAITGSLTSSQGAVSSLSVPFQVTNCATLAFKPQFKVSTAGKTSRTNGASLDVKLTYPKAAWGSQANIKGVKVDLPKQLPSRLTTLQKACTDTVFEQNPASCPAGSRVGTASATTPIIPVGLSGPAYFVSHGGAKFPELVIVLSGYGVTVQLHGETFISPAGITSSTFRTIPDVPIGTFELKLPRGTGSALAANGNLCTSKLKMPTTFTAQNGLVVKQATPIAATGCGKHKTKKKAKTGKHHKVRTHGKKR